MHKSNEPIDTSKGYDVTDLPIKGIVTGSMIFFVFTTASILLALVVLKYVPGGGLGPPPVVARKLAPKAPNPVLQNNITATTDMWKLRADEKRQLESYGWSDKAKGKVHVPIDIAIERAAAQGGQPQ